MTRLNNLAGFAVLVLALSVCAAGILIPLYSDEIAVQMVRARFFLEDGALLNLLPQCRPLLMPIPASWYPGAVFNAILYSGASELGLRIRGIAICGAWLSLLWMWAGRHPQTLISKRSLQGVVLSLNMLGVLPFVLVLARSEQLLVVGLLAYCIFPIFWRSTETDGIYIKGLKAALIFLITSVFLLAHPKALFFSPIILASAFLIFRDAGKLWSVGVLLSLGFAIAQSFQHVQVASRCVDAPAMSLVLAQHTLDFQLLSTDRAAFFREASRNVASSLGLVIERVPVTLVYQSNWLPSVDGKWIEPGLAGFGKLLKVSLHVFALLLLCAGILRVVMELLRKRLEPGALLGISMTAGLVLHGVAYNVNAWHFYTPGLIVPALSILLLLVLDAQWPVSNWIRLVAGAVAFYWMLLAIASMAVLLPIQTPRLLQIARAGDDVIEGQSLSTPVFVREDQHAQIPSLAKRCGIHDGDKRLVLDGAAYFLFQHGRQPINVFYVSDYAFGMDIGQKLPEFLRKIDSGGILSRCEYLPKALLDRAIRSDKMCCISKADL
ncbi:hypothetical protein [Variovorax ginsengisoli]|uniref:Glycosyltransferase RgtA/B/C/D-like domain-containing protein n=1 Tax=Variovorax ginsengisoli TaxID=363844 RepID=A0ABT8RZV1_9BURK|nr:hypothetical protein [Variovorax ginsengisoli]MDN8612820.1 hypothetical protein [Variovorax ginsengisoli]MDO1531990.1 hypothetical protein [Variovorax ginsengisoli]